MKSKYNNSILQYSVLIFGLPILSLFFLLPTMLYGTAICDPSNLTNCDDDEKILSSRSSNPATTADGTQSGSTEAPLVLPDISPTDRDLGTPTTDTDLSDTDSGNNNANSDDSENTADNDDTSRDNEQENEDEASENNEESSSDNDGRTLLPFP